MTGASLTAGPILVTGAAGFVGSYLVELLVSEGVEVVGWQRPGTTPLTTAAVRWMAVELLDADGVSDALGELRPSAVYHLAGSAHVADSWSHTRETFEGNVLATHHLLQGLHRRNLCPRVLVSGSATIYAPGAAPIVETAPIAPASPYATSKLAQEMLAAQAWREQGIPVVLARSFNHVGPRQTPSYVAPSIARQVALIERGALPPVLKMGNLDPERDVMDVRDTVRAYRAMMDAATPGVPYNVCGGRPIRIGDLVDLFRARARVPIAVEQDPSRMRPNDAPRLAGSHARLTADTGWRPRIPLEQTVEELLAWWRTQIDLPMEADRGRG
ncbi:MAG: GDP-mannose 4,6-dehydratase [Acidobacteria bacterium]|nr:GDP-mannose 4,6-dehydratase [Acidobacteriota bacterium]